MRRWDDHRKGPAMSSVSRRLPLVPAGVVVERVDVEPDSVIILASLRRGSAACPGCGCISHRLHSRYQRRVADLPWQGRAVVLRLGLRRLRCANPRCGRQTFSEGLPGIAPAYARRSERLHLIQRHIGLASADSRANSPVPAKNCLGVPYRHRQGHHLTLGVYSFRGTTPRKLV